jgi:hypothetical protein
MRRLLMIATAVFAVVAAVAAADEIWLKDGHSITTKKPVVTKGANALITTVDGVLLSVPLSEIDQAKTAEERARAAVPTPAPTPNLLRPMTPAEAARRSSGRKSVVTLTDDTVAHGFGEEPADKKAAETDGRVEISNSSATKGKDGYAFAGSVLNAGAAPVSAVSVTIEFVGKDGKTFSSTYASVAKDALQPGEKSVFTGSAPLEGEPVSFRYQARWQSLTPIRKADDKGPASGAGTGAKGDAAAEAEPTPVPTPAPAPTLLPRPDVAPPAANAPVGNPANGAFLPPPDVPKTTARPPAT